MIEVELPDGSVAEFPDGTPDDTIKSVLARQFGAPNDKIAGGKTGRITPVDAEKAKLDQYYSSGIYAGEYNPLGPIARAIGAGARGAERAPMMGWDDEITAGIKTGGGFLGDYSQQQQIEDAKKQALREQNPIASTVGEIGGAITAAGALGTRMVRPPAGVPFAPYAAGPGFTLAGRSLPVIGRTGAAALEGAAYGGLTGAGEAQQGERLQGAGYGAALGAATGAAASKVGDALATRAARKAVQQAAPSADDLAMASNALYAQADQAGVTLKPQTTDRLVQNMKVAAGPLNDKLRPNTAGIVQDIEALRGQPMTLKQFDELRQEIGLAMKNAQPQDVRSLQRMKNIVDGLADRASANDVTGNVDGFKMLKDARNIWAKKSKTELVEDLFDLADVKSARYSQSGMQNAIRDKASQLYTRIVKGQEKGFTAEETELIRKLSKSELTPAVVNWLGKFAPRGVVSAGLGGGVGAGIGTALGGPVGGFIGAAAPGAVGFGAAALADRAAVQGMTALRNAAATGQAPVLNAITNKTVPLIGGLSAGTASQAVRQR